MPPLVDVEAELFRQLAPAGRADLPWGDRHDPSGSFTLGEEVDGELPELLSFVR